MVSSIIKLFCLYATFNIRVTTSSMLWMFHCSWVGSATDVLIHHSFIVVILRYYSNFMTHPTITCLYPRAWHARGNPVGVYVFSRISSGSWAEDQKRSPSFRQTQSDFFHGNYGHSVVISDALLAVKAPANYSNGIRGVMYLYKREIERLSTPEGPQTVPYQSL